MIEAIAAYKERIKAMTSEELIQELGWVQEEVIEVETKTCTKCERKKPLEMFGRQKRSKDGKNHWCKRCVNEYSKQHKHKTIPQ